VRVILCLGRLFTVLFWILLLLSFQVSYAKPFAMLLATLGVLLIVMHAVELLLFNQRLRSLSRPWLARICGLLLGIFYLYGMRPTVAYTEHAHELDRRA
jgi:putative membrane protein